MIYILIAAGAIVMCAVCILLFYCYRKHAENKRMFASETHLRDENKKGTRKKRKTNEDMSISFIDANNNTEF